MTAKLTLSPTKFAGTITRGTDVLAVEFNVSGDEHGRLLIQPLPMDRESVRVMLAAMGEPGSYSESVVLKGVAEDSSTFHSDAVDVHGAQFGTQGDSIQLKARKATVSVSIEEAPQRPLMRLWFRGFASFVNTPVKMSLGTVRVGGPSKATNQDEMAGYVAVQAPEGPLADEWKARTDEFLTFMHRGLGFAHGGRLQTPRLDVVIGTCWEATFYEGHGFSKNLSPIHHLNQAPFIEALTKRFDAPQPFPAMLWTAIGWLHNDSISDEGRFLMAVTALETIVEHIIPKTLTTVIEKSKFETVRTALNNAIAECQLGPTSLEIFQGKINGLNGRALSQKIQAVRDHYCLPGDTFSDEAIVEIIKLRNEIVHTGNSKKRRDLWPKEIFIRELIALIAFNEIGYHGPYESYIDGYRSAYMKPPSDRISNRNAE